MVKAYVLIEMMAGHSRNLVKSLKERRVTDQVDRVTGPYDVVALLKADDLGQLSDIVAREIHSVPGVVRTTTCVCLE